MIVLEGPSDTALWAVGKRLRDEFGYSLRRHTPGPEGWKDLTARLADGHCRICLLRSHLSDAVDAHLSHRTIEPEAHAGMRTLELLMGSLSALVLLVTPESAAPTAPVAWDSFSPLRVQRAYAEGWEGLPWTTRLPVLRYPEEQILSRGKFTRRFLKPLLRQIGAEAQAMRYLPPSLGAGSPHPDYLVIGEAPTGSPCLLTRHGDLPDLPFSRGPASELLFRAVDELSLRWWEGYWMNAATFQSGTGWTSSHVPIPRTGKILCLGDAAEALVQHWYGAEQAQMLANCGLWKVVAHPSHIMQFKYRDYPRWRDEIGHFLASSVETPEDLMERGPDLNLDLGF